MAKMQSSSDSHRTLLRKEIALAGISLKSTLPSWCRRGPLANAVLDELLVALAPSIHEGLIPSYGSLLVEPGSTPASFLPVDPGSLELARAASDGSSALMLFEGLTFRGLRFVDAASAPDLQLAMLAAEQNGVAILRDRTGVVRAYFPSGAIRCEGRRWTRSPSIDDAVTLVTRHAPRVNREVLTDLLRFAYYVLSPWHIGATLAWLTDDIDPFSGASVDLQPLRMSVSGRDVPLAFAAHLLAQHDGATTLDRSGRILRTGLHLASSEPARTLIPQHHGTRHTSARRASFDAENAVFVTVSADGPVTIFSDGASLFDLHWYSGAALEDLYKREFGPDMADRFSSYRAPIDCPRCGKSLRLEAFYVTGWNEYLEPDCPVCGASVPGMRCFSVNANVVKRFSQASTQSANAAAKD